MRKLAFGIIAAGALAATFATPDMAQAWGFRIAGPGYYDPSYGGYYDYSPASSYYVSPYYNGQTVEGFVDPGVKGTRIPEYRNITLENITDETPGDVLIAGYDADHRTQVTMDNVTIKGITPDKMHLKLADITNGGTNLPLEKAAEGNDVRITPGSKPAPKPYSCAGKFLPMQ